MTLVPNLRILDIDRNSVKLIKGIDSHKNLGTLLWREQGSIHGSDGFKTQYQEGHEMRHFCLSGTLFAAFAPSTPFLNLHNLELASTGLQTLPSEFGAKCPNLRVLNLNYNALRDLRPLVGANRLQKLYLVGNRLSRLRRTAAVLDLVCKELADVDFRNNPLTVGFYTPQDPGREEQRLVVKDRARCTGDEEKDYESRGARAYLLPWIDKDIDNGQRERLDEDTKLRRRVYEMLVVNACKTLERLDGMVVDKRTIGKKDDIWVRLLELGVLKDKNTGHV